MIIRIYTRRGENSGQRLLHHVVFFAGILPAFGVCLVTQYATAKHQPLEVQDMRLDTEQRAQIVSELSVKLDSDFDQGISELKTRFDGQQEDLGRDLLALAWRYALNSQDTHARQKICVFLLDAARGENQFLAEQALKFLLDFSPSDFNSLATERLKSFYYQEDYANAILRVVGVANLRSEEFRLREIAKAGRPRTTSDAFYASSQWAALLVLARFGETDSINQVVERVKTEEDIVIRSTRLFADLGFTRHYLALDCLREFLRSPERLPQVKETVLGRPEALYAAEVLCKHAENFPLPSCDIQESNLPVIVEWADMQKSWIIRK